MIFILLCLLLLVVCVGMQFSIVSGTVGAVYGAREARHARQQQEKQAQEYNQLLRDMYGESRGSTGHAILPEYLGDTEKNAGERATGVSNALMDFYGTPEDVARRGADVASRYRPLLDEGTKSIYGIYSGDLEKKRLAAAEPVFAARTELADTTRAGIMRGVLQRLNKIRTANAAKGYVGTGSAAENLALRASIEGNQQAGAATASAKLQNEMDRRAIREEILNLQLRSPELAGALAAQAIKFETLPADVAAAIQRGEMSPLDYFRIGVGSPSRPVMAPWATPEASLGQILASATADAGNTAARYFLNRDLAARYGASAGRAPVGGGGGGGYGGDYPGDVGYYNYAGGYQPYNTYYDDMFYAGLGEGAAADYIGTAIGGGV